MAGRGVGGNVWSEYRVDKLGQAKPVGLPSVLWVLVNLDCLSLKLLLSLSLFVAGLGLRQP